MMKLTTIAGIVVACLCTLAIAAVRAQPYHDGDVSAFLILPEGCRVPCFAGVQPGMTPVNDAVDTLQTRDWIQSVIVTGETPHRVQVRWNRSTPDNMQISSITPGITRELSRETIDGAIVNQLTVHTDITFGDLWIASRERARLSAYLVDSTGMQPVYHLSDFFGAGFTVRMPRSCREFWTEAVTLVWIPSEFWDVDDEGITALRSQACRRRNFERVTR